MNDARTCERNRCPLFDEHFDKLKILGNDGMEQRRAKALVSNVHVGAVL